MARLVCSNCRFMLDTRSLNDEESEELHAFDGALVCPACGEVDAFFHVGDELQSALDPDDPAEIEEMHTPHCRIEGDMLVVRIGDGDDPHPMDGDHYLVSVGLYTREGDPIEVRDGDGLDPESPLDFSLADADPDDVEVRLVCNRHGTWRGVPEREKREE